jgi:hypothetical protein
VRVRVSMLLVEALGLESECDNRRKIRTAIESLLFVCYSNFTDREIPDPWPTRGPVQWRPVFAPTKTHTTRHLRSIGMLSGKDGTRFHQDEWFAPKDHESQKPGSMFDGDGMMEGRRKRRLPHADSDMIHNSRKFNEDD